MSCSYLGSLWAAAYRINGDCSDDGFDYFRDWLITQGRDMFEAAVADPDALADNSPVRAASDDSTTGVREGVVYRRDRLRNRDGPGVSRRRDYG
jgi:hypothetical protein